jgi:hypothetical protein
VLRVEPRASFLLGLYSATEPQPPFSFVFWVVLVFELRTLLTALLGRCYTT